MKIGYARVSRTDQNLAPQTDQLKAAGVERTFTDKISGAKSKRPGFEDLLATARTGDCVIVCRLDRFARSLQDLLTIAAEFERRGLQFVSLADNIDTTTTTGKFVFQLLGAVAEMERNLIIDRTRAGLAAAKARGIKGGRKRVLNDAKKTTLDLLLDKSNDYEAHAAAIGVSERTVRRYANGEYAK